MANHVDSYIQFIDLSPKGETELLSIFEEATENEDWYTRLYDKPLEDIDVYEEIGAKWLMLESVEADCLNVTTAWCAPYAFYKQLYTRLCVSSPDLKMFIRFNDEMPNFVGTYGLGPLNFEYDEYVDEDAYEMCIKASPYNEEGDFNDDWWEALDTWYDSEFECMMESLKEWTLYNNELPG